MTVGTLKELLSSVDDDSLPIYVCYDDGFGNSLLPVDIMFCTKGLNMVEDKTIATVKEALIICVDDYGDVDDMA